MNWYSLFWCAGLLLAPLGCLAQTLSFDGFEPLATNPPQEFSTIELGLVCPPDVEFDGKLNNTHWTIEPVQTDTVVIKTSPPNLVDVSVDGGVLRFTHTSVSLSPHANGTGVLIQVPEAQLQGIVGRKDTTFRAWILSGFTVIQTIVQNASFSFLIVELGGNADRISYTDNGEGNTFYAGTDLEVDVNVNGRSHTVTIAGTIKSGTVSASKSLVWANVDIEELTVSGPQNRIFVGNTDGCSNVNFEEERFACEVLIADITPTEVTPLSNEVVEVTCPVEESQEEEENTPGSGSSLWGVSWMASFSLIVATGFASWTTHF